MSIRAEEAVDQVSRFSLRACVVGTETRPPTQAPRPPLPPRPQPQQTQPQPQQSNPKNGNFTFASLVKPPPSTSAVSPARDPLATARAFAAISAAQRSSTAAAPAAAAASRATDARTLPIGFISGGTTQTASKAELLRLTATVDTLHSQLSQQSGRLQRTEASLVKANRELTAQAAMANSRLVRLQNNVKEARASEEKFRAASASALLRTAAAAPATPTPSFEAAAKNAEAREAEMTALNATIEGLRSERDHLNTSSAALKDKLDASTTEAIAAREDAAAKAAVVSDLQARLGTTNETATKATSELQTKLDEVTAEALASAAAALAAKNEAEATKARLEQSTAEAASNTASAAVVEELQARIEQITADAAEAIACTTASADAAEAAAAEAAEAKAGTKLAEEALANIKLQQVAPRPDTQVAVPLQAHTLSYFYNLAPSTSPVQTTTTTRQKRRSVAQSTRPLIGAAHAAKRSLFAKSAIATFDDPRECNLINHDCCSIGAAQQNDITVAFVAAVSADALQMCRSQRRRVLTAIGLTSDEVDADLSMFEAK